MMNERLDWAFSQYAFEDLSRDQWGQIVAEVVRLRMQIDKLERDLNGYDAGEVDKW